MKASAKRLGLLLGLALAGTAVADGFGRHFSMGASGTVAVTNSQVNSVWRPVVLAVQCGEAAERTVTVSRVVGGMEYPIAQTEGTAASYVYEFDGVYWFGFSNALQIAVRPACTGTVEVIFE